MDIQNPSPIPGTGPMPYRTGTLPSQSLKPAVPLPTNLPEPAVFSNEKPMIPVKPPVPPPPPPLKRALPKKLISLAALLLGIFVIILVSTFIIPRLRPVKDINIVWWGLWENEAIIKPLIDEYQSKNPKVKITYMKRAQQNYRERLVNDLDQGKGPDIFRFHNSWVPMFRSHLDPIPASIMSSSEFSQTYYPVAATDLTYKTGILGLPLEYDGLGLYINEEVFEKAGKTFPVTWDDLRTTAINLTIKDENGGIKQAGVALGRTENVDHWPEIVALMMLQNRVRLSNPQGKLAEDALEFFTVFSRQDKVWDQTLPPSTVAFAQGKLAMYFGPSWRVFDIKELNPDLRFRVIPVPQLPKESPNEQDITYASYWVEGVWSKSKNKEAAWEFLKFLSSKESLQKFYQNASKQRLFGEPYPRSDMANTLFSDPTVGAFVATAPFAQSWYLASFTWDGATGINTKINKYFEDAINKIVIEQKDTLTFPTLAKGVEEVLSEYGLSTAQTR